MLYRRGAAGLEILLGHMGGPFWSKKDAGAWSIPKGVYVEGEEDPYAAARREFSEETGFPAPEGEAIDLGEVRQSSGKRVRAWALEGDLDAAAVVSNEFELEWPPKSGKMRSFPEIDRAGWFGPDEAREKLTKSQVPLVAALEEALGAAP